MREQPQILIVDDEEIVLVSIRSLLKIETDYQVDCYTDPLRALDHARENNVDLVIADYLMAQMDGIEFLRQLREVQPEATRILLTGYGDKQSAIRGINEVGLYHYLEKPWDNEQLLLTIRNGLQKRFLVQELQQRISELDDAHRDLKEIQTKLLKAFV